MKGFRNTQTVPYSPQTFNAFPISDGGVNLVGQLAMKKY
jgi:hypothetical protein